MLSVEYVEIYILPLALKIIPQSFTNGYPASPVAKYLELILIIQGSPAVRVNWHWCAQPGHQGISGGKLGVKRLGHLKQAFVGLSLPFHSEILKEEALSSGIFCPTLQGFGTWGTSSPESRVLRACSAISILGQLEKLRLSKDSRDTAPRRTHPLSVLRWPF